MAAADAGVAARAGDRAAAGAAGAVRRPPRRAQPQRDVGRRRVDSGRV